MATVAASGQPGAEQVPQWAKDLQKEVADVRQTFTSREEAQRSEVLEQNIEGSLEQVIKAAIPDLNAYWGYVRNLVLADLLPYQEEQVYAAAQNGTLANFIKERTEIHAETVRGIEKSRAEAIASKVNGTKTGGPQKPLATGSAGTAAPEEINTRGGGLNAMTKRMRGGLGLNS